MTFTLETLLTSKAGFDLPTASPLQRAICRSAEGLPIGDALSDDAIERHFGCTRAMTLTGTAPTICALVCGVRSGKSLLAACAAVKAAITVDLSPLKKHEIPRYSIVAPTVDNASATLRLLVGSLTTSPQLTSLVDGDPTADTVRIRRPDGRVVEICVVAAHRAGITLRSRWSIGAVFDEVAMFGADVQGAAVSAEGLLEATEPRLLAGAQVWLISSPNGPSGLLYDHYAAHFGKPGRVLVVHAPTVAMNPAFPVAQVEALRAAKPDVAARELDAEWLDADSAFLDGHLIEAAKRAEPLEEPRRQGASYVAAWDAATRGNSWTLVVARSEMDREGIARVIVSLATQWTGSKTAPLDPDKVVAEVAAILKRYGVRQVLCDGWAVDALASIANARGIKLRERNRSPIERAEAYDGIRTLLATSRLELPPHPVLVQDLKSVRKKALANGVRIELPRTADGRHCDFAPALSLVCGEAPKVMRANRTSDDDAGAAYRHIILNNGAGGTYTPMAGDLARFASGYAGFAQVPAIQPTGW